MLVLNKQIRYLLNPGWRKLDLTVALGVKLLSTTYYAGLHVFCNVIKRCFICTCRFGRRSVSLSTDVNRTNGVVLTGAELKALEDEKSSPQRRRNVENDKDWEDYWEHYDKEAQGSDMRETTV